METITQTENKDIPEPPSQSGFDNLKNQFYKFKKTFYFDIVETVVVAVLLAYLIQLFIIQAFFIPTGSMIGTLLPKDRILATKYYYKYWNLKRRDIIIFKYPEDKSKEFIKRLIGLPGDTIEFKKDYAMSSMDQGFYDLYVNGEKQDEPFIYAFNVLIDGDTTNEFGEIIDRTGNIIDKSMRQTVTLEDIRKRPDFFKDIKLNQITVKTRSVLGISDFNGYALNDKKTSKHYEKIVVPNNKLYVLGDNRNNSLDSRYWGYVDMDEHLEGKAFMVYWPLKRMKFINPINMFNK